MKNSYFNGKQISTLNAEGWTLLVRRLCEPWHEWESVMAHVSGRAAEKLHLWSPCSCMPVAVQQHCVSRQSPTPCRGCLLFVTRSTPDDLPGYAWSNGPSQPVPDAHSWQQKLQFNSPHLGKKLQCNCHRSGNKSQPIWLPSLILLWSILRWCQQSITFCNSTHPCRIMHMLQKPDLYKIGQSSIQGVRIMKTLIKFNAPSQGHIQSI